MANMSLTRWEPFREMATLRNAMDRLFEESFPRSFRWFEGMGVGVPMDVYEEEGKYVVEVALPGVRPDDVDVSLRNNTLTVTGKIVAPEGKGRTYLLQERGTGEFTRTVSLPAEIDADKVQATFEHGVLHLDLPKTPAYQPKRISIKTTS